MSGLPPPDLTLYSASEGAARARGAFPVVVNGAAGGGCPPERLKALEDAFAAARAPMRLVQTGPGEDISTLTSRLVAERPPAIVAAGGDGTVNAVASALAGTGVPLGVMPLGTLNHFARDLAIPLDLEAAARTIAAGEITEVDVACVNGHPFINNSSLGLYPHIVRHREQQQRRLGRGKWAALAWATWTTLRRNPFLTVDLSTDAEDQRCTASFVFIGNNLYEMEGFSIGRRERIDAGRLSLYICQRGGRLGLLMLALRALFGRLHQADDFNALTARRIRIETKHAVLPVATDGEVVMLVPPLEYSIRPRALRVLVPAQQA